ncbi:MAG: sulfatase-like hydrolase/transferase, partial [Calditrichaeota bacterium]|nr:sulfatase-like hydrolase/transferase [Calditrichota bacterium]
MMIKRRDFLKSISTLGATGVVPVFSCKRKSQKKFSFEPFRNVVVLVSDDHATTVLGCYGNTIIRTPNLDRMARTGVRFVNAFASAPVCNASRQSVLTGKYPHADGVTLLETPFPADQLTLAEHLKKYGFKTAVVGKTHFYNDLPHGFEVMIGRKDYHQYLVKHPPKKPPESMKTRPPWRPF